MIVLSKFRAGLDNHLLHEATGVRIKRCAPYEPPSMMDAMRETASRRQRSRSQRRLVRSFTDASEDVNANVPDDAACGAFCDMCHDRNGKYVYGDAQLLVFPTRKVLRIRHAPPDVFEISNGGGILKHLKTSRVVDSERGERDGPGSIILLNDLLEKHGTQVIDDDRVSVAANRKLPIVCRLIVNFPQSLDTNDLYILSSMPYGGGATNGNTMKKSSRRHTFRYLLRANRRIMERIGVGIHGRGGPSSDAWRTHASGYVCGKCANAADIFDTYPFCVMCHCAMVDPYIEIPSTSLEYVQKSGDDGSSVACLVRKTPRQFVCRRCIPVLTLAMKMFKRNGQVLKAFVGKLFPPGGMAAGIFFEQNESNNKYFIDKLRDSGENDPIRDCYNKTVQAIICEYYKKHTNAPTPFFYRQDTQSVSSE